MCAELGPIPCQVRLKLGVTQFSPSPRRCVFSTGVFPSRRELCAISNSNGTWSWAATATTCDASGQCKESLLLSPHFVVFYHWSFVAVVYDSLKGTTSRMHVLVAAVDSLLA